MPASLVHPAVGYLATPTAILLMQLHVFCSRPATICKKTTTYMDGPAIVCMTMLTYTGESRGIQAANVICMLPVRMCIG